MAKKQEAARIRKMKSRQRHKEIAAQLARVSSKHMVGGAGMGGVCSDDRVLRLAIRAVRHVVEQDNQPTPPAPSFAKEAIMRSTTLGTLLVRTRDFLVLESNKALDNLWMLSEEHGHMGSGLAGQSL